METVLVPLYPFLMVVLVVGFVFYFGHRNKREVLETVRQASANGTQLTPELIRELGASGKKPGADNGVRAGVILLAVALACIVLGYTLQAAAGEPEIFPVLTGIAAFPGFIGIALIATGLMIKPKDEDRDSPIR